jgi:hypothetical protein
MESKAHAAIACKEKYLRKTRANPGSDLVRDAGEIAIKAGLPPTMAGHIVKGRIRLGKSNIVDNPRTSGRRTAFR